MNTARRFAVRNHKQRGYALLMMVFFTLLLMLAATAAAPRILTQGKREKEEEMIWRGKQYVRAIKLYYRKTGKFPTSIDDLTKPKLGSLRFLRQPYKDPMNKSDGSWRLLYVGPAGQIIGSLKPQPAGVQMPGGAGFGTPVSSMNGVAGINGQNPNGAQTATTPGQTSGQGTWHDAELLGHWLCTCGIGCWTHPALEGMASRLLRRNPSCLPHFAGSPQRQGT